MKRICVLVSGGGTNLQAIIDAQQSGIIHSGSVVSVVSSSHDAFALTRAQKAGIETTVIARRDYGAGEFDAALCAHMDEKKIDLIVMAGFMCIVGEKLLEKYAGRIINVHPSLIPSFCGEGFYGLRVHKAALEYGVKVTGATVHYVTGVVDGGKIIAQKAVETEEGDTPEILQKRVMENAEWVILPQAIEKICSEN